MSEFDDIKNRKTLKDIFSNFESLLGYCLLFDKNSDYYKFSGFVTAALLDHEEDGKITIFSIKTSSDWFTFRYTRGDLEKMFSHCVAFVGKDEKDSFLLET